MRDETVSFAHSAIVWVESFGETWKASPSLKAFEKNPVSTEDGHRSIKFVSWCFRQNSSWCKWQERGRGSWETLKIHKG